MTARLTPQREAEMTAGRRADLLVMLLHGGAATNSIATYIVDALVTAVRAESAAELAAVRAELAEAQRQLTEYEPLNPQQCPAGKHTDWLVDSEYTHACPWCRIDRLKEEAAFAERCTLPDLRRTVDHHKGGKERWRKRALEAEAMVRELKRPAVEKERNETRTVIDSFVAEARKDGDHEGAAQLAHELDKYEAKWQHDDETVKSATGRDELKQRVTRAIYALPSPSPSSSEHYRSGWDVGLEASVDAARTALDGEARS